MNSAISSSETLSNSRPTEAMCFSRLAIWVTAVLLTSGCVHFALIALLGTNWHGPVSLRKPALFGISGGLTAWSIAWLMTQLRPKKFDRAIVDSLAIALFIEVALITFQYWRGVASHFNHATHFDGAIEFTMLGLILFVTGEIFYLTLRTFRLRAIEPAMAIAIRGGMWLLALSCLLGIVNWVLGEVSLSEGRSSELWGRAGVLKFPHGVALHAIQFLPILAWLARNLGLNHSVRIVQSALAAQILFVLYAVWQTSRGRDRFDWDGIGGSLLWVAVLFGLFPAFALAQACIRYVGWKT